MNILNKNKKGQGLPLQTIVIAILVIIVLLVIVLFFVTKMADAGSGVDTAKEGFTECVAGSYGIGDDYVGVDYYEKCDVGYTRFYTVPKRTSDNYVCCGMKEDKNRPATGAH